MDRAGVFETYPRECHLTKGGGCAIRWNAISVQEERVEYKRVKYHVVLLTGVCGILGTRRGHKDNAADVKAEWFKHWRSREG